MWLLCQINMNKNKNVIKGYYLDYSEELFTKGYGEILAEEIEPGMIISMCNYCFFEVDDVVKSYLNDEIADYYMENDLDKYGEIKPEHTLITLYIVDDDDDTETEIRNIPGDAKIIAFWDDDEE